MPHARKTAAIVTKLLEWYPKNARDLPWRRTTDPYRVYVSEIMLQQTQVKTVIPYWERWMGELPTIQSLARARPTRIHKLWEGLGYYSRVRNMQRAAQVIVKQYAGEFPQEFERILELPGIGRYTAGAICSIAFNQPKPVLDGNVMRVLTRLHGIGGDPREGNTHETLWTIAGELVQHAAAPSCTNTFPGPTASHLNQALMELGAVICTPRQPDCNACPLASHCQALRDGRVEELPATRPRAQITERRFLAFVVRSGDRWLVQQRPAGVVNAHLWEFPNFELLNGERNLKQAAGRALGFTPKSLVPLTSFKHSITRYRITLEVFESTLPRAPKAKRSAKPRHWLTWPELNRLAFASAHRKILKGLHPD